MKSASVFLIIGSLAALQPIALDLAYSQAYKPPIEAKVGEVATGSVVKQDTRTLILNTTPCGGDRQKQIVIFHSPFETRPAVTARCSDGKTYDQVTATQR